jgi:hypothetical protein
VNRTLIAVASALLVALAAIGIASGGEEEAAPQRSPESSVRPVARGVERVRELRFDHLPRVRVVSAAQARRAGLSEIDRYTSRRDQRLEERLLELLGLLAPGSNLRALVGKAIEGEVAGYYIPRADTLALVRGTDLGGLLGEVALAHELTHALEDQHFGIEPDPPTRFMRDRSVAESALHEGTATLAMVDYLARSRGLGDTLPEGLRGQLLDQLDDLALPLSSDLPRYLREGLIFPYAAGARFVDAIQGQGGWGAVDRVYQRGGPVSTEQVMHPDKYEEGERPAAVRLGDYRSALGDGARTISRGDIGEFDTAQFLLEANGRGRAEQAAAGWGGGRFALWRLPGGGDVLVVGWTWDTTGDALDFERAARRQVPELATPGAVRRDGALVAVVLAPEAPLARRVARLAAS